MAIQEGPEAIGDKGLKSFWPIEEGLTAATQRQVNERILHTEEQSLVEHRKKELL